LVLFLVGTCTVAYTVVKVVVSVVDTAPSVVLAQNHWRLETYTLVVPWLLPRFLAWWLVSRHYCSVELPWLRSLIAVFG
jgi:hypothetical protein